MTCSPAGIRPCPPTRVKLYPSPPQLEQTPTVSVALIAMRLQHAKKTASTLPAETPERENARAVIVAEVDRLRWRIWNGKDAKVTLERIREVMPAFQGEQGGRKRDPSSRRLWTALREIDRYLTSQSAWLVNY